MVVGRLVQGEVIAGDVHRCGYPAPIRHSRCAAGAEGGKCVVDARVDDRDAETAPRDAGTGQGGLVDEGETVAQVWEHLPVLVDRHRLRPAQKLLQGAPGAEPGEGHGEVAVVSYDLRLTGTHAGSQRLLQPAEPLSLETEHIIVVEDEATLAATLRRFLFDQVRVKEYDEFLRATDVQLRQCLDRG